MIKLEGSPLGNVVGWVVLVGLIGLGYVAISAAMKRHIVAAAVAALFAGLFLALALMMFAIRLLDTLTTVKMPVALAVIAALVATNRPRSVF